jgi:hypothetical protein
MYTVGCVSVKQFKLVGNDVIGTNSEAQMQRWYVVLFSPSKSGKI